MHTLFKTIIMITEDTANQIRESKKHKKLSFIDEKLSVVQELSNTKVTRKDFQVLSVIGKGAFAKVCLSTYKEIKFGLKMIDKKFMEQLEKTHEPFIERYILLMLDHPFIIKLYTTFQDAKSLYFVLDYCKNRSLAELLHVQGVLSGELTLYYTACIVEALVYLRKVGICHRDLKPENIVLDENMKIKLVSKFSYSDI